MTTDDTAPVAFPSDCPRCGKNHYDTSRPTVPGCPFTPSKLGPSGGDVPDILAMLGLAAADERYATGALYRSAAEEIRRLRAALAKAEGK